jgi:hypothetical protein
VNYRRLDIEGAPLFRRLLKTQPGSIGVNRIEFVFAQEERDVYSYEHTPKDLAPLGAKLGSRTFADAGKSDCAPTELRSKERTARL